jgi:hypothetical protein
MQSKDIKIYKCKKDENPYYWGRLTFVIGNSKVYFYRALKSGTELTFTKLSTHEDGTISVEDINGLGMRLHTDITDRIFRWYTTDELVKIVKDATHNLMFKKKPTDPAWVSVFTHNYISRIYISDKNNRWALEMAPEIISKLTHFLLRQYDGGSKMKWPFDKVPVSESTYEPLIPLDAIVKTLQANYNTICDPLAWKDNKITFKTVTK